ncbi:MAG: hypothetical protein ACXABO_12595 [Promethearchaeota archaeon]
MDVYSITPICTVVPPPEKVRNKLFDKGNNKEVSGKDLKIEHLLVN